MSEPLIAPAYMTESGDIKIDTSSSEIIFGEPSLIYVEATTSGGVVGYLPISYTVEQIEEVGEEGEIDEEL